MTYVPKVDNGKIRVSVQSPEGIETELTERSKMHYLDQDTFWAVLSDVWKRHAPTTGMTPKQLRESLSAQGALRDLNAVSVSHPASIRFLEMRVGRRTHMKKIIEVQQAIQEMVWPYQNNRSSIAGGSKALFLGAQTNRGLHNGCVVRRTFHEQYKVILEKVHGLAGFTYVLMRPGFVISGCAEPALVASADDEPVISVPSSPREVVEEEALPGKDKPNLIPGKGQEAMVCVQATRSSQTPPLIVPDVHRVLEGTGVLECPDHKLDHGVPDSKRDYRKRALGPLYRHSALKEAREIPILTFDFSGPHPSTVHPAKQLMVIVWCLKEVRLIWALGVENRDDPHVVAGLLCKLQWMI